MTMHRCASIRREAFRRDAVILHNSVNHGVLLDVREEDGCCPRAATGREGV